MMHRGSSSTGGRRATSFASKAKATATASARVIPVTKGITRAGRITATSATGMARTVNR